MNMAMPKVAKLKVRTLDMSKADGGYTVREADVIYRALRKDRINRKSLLFSGLEGDNLDMLLEHGTLYPDSDFIWASTEPDKDEAVSQDTTPLSCAYERNTPMIAVYNKSEFTRDGNNQ